MATVMAANTTAAVVDADFADDANDADNGNNAADAAAQEADAAAESMELADEEVPLAVTGGDEADTELLELEDEEVPLANMEAAEQNGRNGFWWSIIPLVAAATAGKTAYDKKHKKGIFAEKETVKDSNRNR
ncbi:MAG: hypothetical protein NC548_53165 [Lachnospiraceae bacterium]|nr:hypothetical protein [Lachnospiraceae bacterium]